MLTFKQTVLGKIGMALGAAVIAATVLGGIALAAERGPTDSPEPVAPASTDSDGAGGEEEYDDDSDNDDDASDQSSTEDGTCDGADEGASDDHDADDVQDHDDHDDDDEGCDDDDKDE